MNWKHAFFLLLFLLTLLFWGRNLFLSILEVNRGALLMTTSLLGEQTGREMAAAKHFEQALRYRSEAWQAYVGLGVLAHQQNQTTASVRYWENALEVSKPASPLLYGYGEALLANGNETEALAVWQPIHAEIKFTTEADFWREQGALQMARERYELALAINPQWTLAKIRLNNVLRQLIREAKESDDEAQEFELLKQVIEHSPRPNDFVGLGDLARKAERTTEAYMWYEQGERLDPQHAVIHQRLGLLALQADELTEAERRLRRAIVLDKENEQAYQLLGRTLFLQEELADAQKVLLEGLEHHPDYAWLYARLGDVYREQGLVREAKEAYQQALRLSPQMSYAQRQLNALQER